MNYAPQHTVRQYFQFQLLDECVSELRPNTIKEIRIALNHWERRTDNRPLKDVSADDVRQLRDTMLADGKAPRTVAKTWAHLSTIFRAAKFDSIIPDVPQAARLRKSILPKAVRHERKQQRLPLTTDELQRLFYACSAAKYPIHPDRVFLWQSALYLFWMYGPRTRDLLALTRNDINTAARLLKFRAMKTGKLHGLPITEFGMSVLDKLQQLDGGGGMKLFPGFNKTGNWNTPKNGKRPRWISGYYATWNADICPAAGVIPHTGPAWLIKSIADRPDAVPCVQLKTFRQTMVTELNDYSKHVHSSRQLGAWVAGHYMPDVTSQNYDYPAADICEAVALRETQRLPECFRHIV